jgi:hypothetical protein
VIYVLIDRNCDLQNRTVADPEISKKKKGGGSRKRDGRHLPDIVKNSRILGLKS